MRTVVGLCGLLLFVVMSVLAVITMAVMGRAAPRVPLGELTIRAKTE